MEISVVAINVALRVLTTSIAALIFLEKEKGELVSIELLSKRTGCPMD